MLRLRVAGGAVIGLLAVLLLLTSCTEKKEITQVVQADLASYVGSEACQSCHAVIYDSFKKTGHPYKLTPVDSARQAGYYPFTELPGPPPNYSWDDVTYVIGGFWWKARYVGTDGNIITAGGNNQYNFETGEWVDYHKDEDKPYDCGGCHTTGYDTAGHQDGLEGIVGTWAFPGVQCEECHGKGSLHSQSPRDYSMIVERSSAMCGKCHVRGSPYEIDASGGFIRHHEQYDEILATKKFNTPCVDCHDPHLGLHEFNPDRDQAIRIDCGTCHYKEEKAFLESDLRHAPEYDCIDCHMPYAAKSAVAVSTYKGDVRSHLFRINTDSTAEMFSAQGSANGYLTLEYACLPCHDKTKGWAARWADKVHPIEEAEPTELTAPQVSAPPILDGSPSDAAWAGAGEITVSLGDGMEGFNCGLCHAKSSAVSVTLKAVYTTSKLYVLASWPDNTASFTRSGSWSFETGAWTRPNSEQSEDRIAFFWPIGTIGGDAYSTGGCMTKCHTDGSGVYLASGRADTWHMKAGRSLGVSSASGSGLIIDASTHEVTGGAVTMVGWMDDKYVGPWRDHEDVGRYGDAGSSTYSNNRISDGSRPKYMERSPTDFMDAMILTQAEIDAEEATGDEDSGVSDDSAAMCWPNYASLNAVVPERILAAPAGSRGDIAQAAAWSGGVWTTEIARDLDTGNDDDVLFAPGIEYTFGLSVMDNGGGDIHKPSEKLTLKLIQSESAPVVRWWQVRR